MKLISFDLYNLHFRVFFSRVRREAAMDYKFLPDRRDYPPHNTWLFMQEKYTWNWPVLDWREKHKGVLFAVVREHTEENTLNLVDFGICVMRLDWRLYQKQAYEIQSLYLKFAEAPVGLYCNMMNRVWGFLSWEKLFVNNYNNFDTQIHHIMPIKKWIKLFPRHFTFDILMIAKQVWGKL